MGKIRIKKIGFGQSKPEKKKKKVKEKVVKVPGLKGGERVKAVEGVIIEEGDTEALKEGIAETPRKVPSGPRGKPKEDEAPEEKVARKPKIRGKKYQKAAKLIDAAKLYPPDQALELAKKTSISSFDGAVEAHVNLFAKFTGVKFALAFPRNAGKKPVILAFGKGAKKAGADIEGNEKTIEKIANGFKDFTVVLANPEWMGKLAKVAKFLGPRGLMPNPKTGTMTENLKEAIKKFKSDKVTLVTEKKAPIIHTVLGKVSWPKKDLRENLEALINAVEKTKIKSLTLCASMGPGIKVKFM